MLVDLTIRRYKSLRDVGLQRLPAFSVMVGANASGKSNLVDALDFLSIVARSGLVAAVSAKGGYENICFRRARRSKAAIEFDVAARIVPSRRAATARGVGPLSFRYGFGFRAETRRIGAEYKVTHERLAVRRVDAVGGEVEIVREGGREPKVQVSGKAGRGLLPFSGDFLKNFVRAAPLSEDELLCPTRLGSLPVFSQFFGFLARCRVYQISPEMARAAGVPAGSPELGRHGENLPAAVEYLKRNQLQAFEELVSHLKHAVSTMESLETGYVETKELGLFFKEQGVGRRWYAQDVSDGTLKTVSMFLPLLDPRVTIVVIEEPENNLHPWILRHFMEACRAQGGGKQIFVTTHSPVAIDEVPVESLFIVRRRAGRTAIERLNALFPEAAQVVRDELFGLGEYWDSGAISGVPDADVE